VPFDNKVKALMDAEPLIITLDTGLANVVNAMAEEDKKAAIIMDGNNVKGIIKFSDICYAIKVYILEKLLSDDIPFDIRKMQIEELMRNPTIRDMCKRCGFGETPPISVQEDNSVTDVIKVMATSGLDTLLVNRGEDELGVLTDSDLIKLFKK
jgi:predicted transcriptional regulator